MAVVLELQESIKSSLQKLKNLEALKKLFWSQLNYERENKELSRRTLSDAVKSEVEGEPLLLASGGANCSQWEEEINARVAALYGL